MTDDYRREIVDGADPEARIYFIRYVDFGEASGLDKETGDVQEAVVLTIAPFRSDEPDEEPMYFLMEREHLTQFVAMASDFLASLEAPDG